MNKKGQISVEFIMILGLLLLFLFFILNTTHKEINQNRALISIKSRTIDLINLSDSRAILFSMDFLIQGSYLEVTINIKRDNPQFTLYLSDYAVVINSIKKTTGFSNVNINFNYLT